MKNMFLLTLFIVFFLMSCGNESNTGSHANNDTTSGTTSANMPVQTKQLEPVFSDSMYQFTGIAKEPGGRLFIVYPRWSPIYRYGLVTAQGMNGVQPYPDSAMNMWRPGQSGQNKWVCVQSMYIDDNGDFWVIDPSAPMLKKIQGNGAKLVKLDKSGKVVKTYPIGNIIIDTSYANDVRIDTKANFAYMTDSKPGGIIVIDLQSGKMREVLRAHSSTVSDPAYKFIIDGRELIKEGKPAKFNSDGIALTPDGAYLYYKPLTDDKLYRIKTDYLRDFNMKDADLATKAEDLGHFNSTDGMMFDKEGNLYMGDLQKYEIVKFDKNMNKTVLVQDNKLIWPDTYSIADGYLYFTCSQINMQPEYNNGINKRTTPYTVYRIKL